MKSLKRYLWGGVLFVLIFGTLSHFIYGWTNGNFFIGLFVPVNESAWEHMKLVFFPMVIYCAFMEDRLTADYPEIFKASCCGILAGTWLVSFLFYGYSGILGQNYFVLDLAVFILSVLGGFGIIYLIIKSKAFIRTKNSKWLLALLVIVMALCFMVYSFKPLNFGVFISP